MNLAAGLEWFDRMRTIPGQRWGLIAVAVVAAVAASAITGLVAGQMNWVVLTLVFGTAIASTVRPDFHTALLVETIVVWYWAAGTDDPLTPWAIPTGLCVFVFHSAVALMSAASMRAIIEWTVIRRWSIRSGWVVIATGAAWSLVVVMNGRQAPGSVAATFVAFVTLTVLVLVARLRSAPSGVDADPSATAG
jgi:hypothetical protein